MTWPRAFLAVAIALVSQGVSCAPAWNSVIRPGGPQAAHIDDLWWLMLTVCTVVFLLVIGFLCVAVWRGRHKADAKVQPALGSTDARSTRWIVVALGVAIIGLLFLLAASVGTDRALERLSTDNALQIDLTSHDWWWDATYQDASPAKIFTTANELHIPVGRTVVLTLRSDDVIHSFWVPSLSGKKDLIPGRISTVVLSATQPGVYQGQCAEFCGYQHAHMALLLFADAPEAYEKWASAQRSPPAPPTDAQAVRGRDLFVSGDCAMCHAIGGTTAQARHAPDLSHVASRQTLAAGTLDNTAANLAAWITDPQGIKPGANMPPTRLSATDLDALLAYIATLR
jgi:cytochrome c oxidase subunit 2